MILTFPRRICNFCRIFSRIFNRIFKSLSNKFPIAPFPPTFQQKRHLTEIFFNFNPVGNKCQKKNFLAMFKKDTNFLVTQSSQSCKYSPQFVFSAFFDVRKFTFFGLQARHEFVLTWGEFYKLAHFVICRICRNL